MGWYSIGFVVVPKIMFFAVLRLSHDFQVFFCVIGLIPVTVMNYLVVHERPSEHGFRYRAVFMASTNLAVSPRWTSGPLAVTELCPAFRGPFFL